jgi:subtilisin family serine protease
MHCKTAVIMLLAVTALIMVTGQADAGKIHPGLVGPRCTVSASDSVDVWIIFDDRGFADQESLLAALNEAAKSLLPENRYRRYKVKTGSLVDIHDLPVNKSYVTTVLGMGARYRTVSRYMNALSVRVSPDYLTRIAEYSFVKEIRPVAKAWRPLPQPDWNLPQPSFRHLDGTDELNYGPSYDQLNQINVIAVHDSGYSGAGVLVCLLDTGFYTDHEALVNQPIIAEWDFINDDPETQNEPGDPYNQHNHGTYTFSALGGAHDGDLYGPAYGASFILGKTENIAFELPIEEDWYVAGLEWADSLGAQVVSTSLGYFDWYTFEDLDGNTAVTTIGVDIAVANGIICVTAAGNERNSSWGHIIAPADADSVISVGAVNSEGELVGFSSPGPTYDGRIKPEVCARGDDTWCALPPSASYLYGGVSGTSLATPLVGGSCALILEAHPDWTPMMVREALLNTADNAAAPNNDYGWGIIDVLAAIEYNFAPTIVQRHPLAGTFVAFPDTTEDFWVNVTDYEEDRLIYHWWVDSEEVYTGFDSTFRYAWTQPGESLVKVIVEDAYGGMDSTEWTVQIESVLGVEGDELAELPSRFLLHGNYPNPFNPSTTIEFNLPVPADVTLEVYDLAGRVVAELIHDRIEAGRHHLTFDATGLASGIYIARLSAADYAGIIKMVLVR